MSVRKLSYSDVDLFAVEIMVA